jgi:hypothetical protein
LKKAGLNRKLTPIDLLFKYGKIYHGDPGEHSMIFKVPKKVRDLEEKRVMGGTYSLSDAELRLK